jgi:hypothetical protein
MKAFSVNANKGGVILIRIHVFFIVILLLLVGCGSVNSNTPQDALDKIHIESNFAKVIEIYEMIDVGGDRVISVYRGTLSNKESIFVANIEKESGLWKVTDAIDIGMPSVDKIHQSSSTDKFKAGYKDRKTNSSENVKIVELDDSEFDIWIEVF